MAVDGKTIKLAVNTGTEQSPTWTVVGEQTGLTLEEVLSEVDVSSKDGPAFLPGRYGATGELGGFYLPSSAEYALLQTAVRSGTLVKAHVEEQGNATEEADVIVTRLSRDFPDEGGATISISFRVAGNWDPAT